MSTPTRYHRPAAESQAWDSQSNAKSCPRCHGYMIHDSYLDPYSNSGTFAIAILRCVQCGNVLDPVIVTNRRKSKTVAA